MGKIYLDVLQKGNFEEGEFIGLEFDETKQVSDYEGNIRIQMTREDLENLYCTAVNGCK